MGRRRLFIFDTENFHFGQVPRKIGRTLAMLFVYMLLTFTLAVLVYLAFTLVFRTDTERRLRREIRMYERIYADLEKREELLGDAIANLQHKDNDIYAQVFHSPGAPMLDPLDQTDAVSALDTIPESRLMAYTAGKVDALMQQSKSVDASFERIFRALSDSSFVLPPMSLPIADITYPQVGASAGRKMNACAGRRGRDGDLRHGVPQGPGPDGPDRPCGRV